MTGGTRHGTQQWVLALAAWMVVVGGLSACTGPQGGVSPRAPKHSEKAATGSPVAAVAPTPTCDEYEAFVNDPEVRGALEKRALWPDVTAELEKAAAGEQIDQEHARQLSEQLADVTHPLRESEFAASKTETSQRAIRALGLSARLSERMGRKGLDQKAAAAALAELKQAIADYEEQAKAEETRCGSS
jgi:hypothetical protein